MYVIVRLLKGFPQPLIYKVPSSITTRLTVGHVVEVPLKTQFKPAVVLKVCEQRPKVAYDIKEVHAVRSMPNDPEYQKFVETLARIYFTKPLHFYQRLRAFLQRDASEEEVERAEVVASGQEVTLTDEQQAAATAIVADVAVGRYRPTLLHGVTGSGKTEVYKAAIRAACAQGTTTLFLCPEVSLARQFHAIFQATLGNELPVVGLHSATTKKERERVWQLAVQGEPCLIVGVHLPVLLPLANLGLILIDEEHEPGFVEKKHPKINSKHAALLRARQYGIPIVLGSATPSVTTLHTADEQKWQRFSLTQRFSGAFPRIQHVILAKGKKRPHFWFSNKLVTALRDTLFRRQQAIIYLNRRGYSFFAQCGDCAHIFSCENCAVSLTVHMQNRVGGPERELRCHYCDFRGPLPPFCPCGVSTKDIKDKGIGTQQAVAALQKLLPEARIARADTDVSRRKKAWAETIEAFGNHELDILVGTQIITKGYHFPKVTLVGVVWADSSVHFPVYNAHETALQQLIQVAGRAGRVATESRVIIQSFDDHDLFGYLDEQKYLTFCQQELEMRQMFEYPPFGRMLTIEITGSNEQQVATDARAVAQLLRMHAPDSVSILGPAAPVIAKVQRTHYRQIICKAPDFAPLYALIERLLPVDVKSSVQVAPF